MTALRHALDPESLRVLAVSGATLATTFTSLDIIFKTLISLGTLAYLALKIRRAWKDKDRRNEGDDE